MRLFEILMLLLILPALVWSLLPWRRPRWVDYLPLAALTIMLIHLFVEGYRWQMLPAYLLIVIVFLLNLPRLGSATTARKQRSGWTIASSILGLLVWLLALALPTLLPVPQLPQVTGPYAIATRTFHLVDESRNEIYTADPDDNREIIMQVWYPADANAQGKPAVYLEDLETMAPILAQRLGLPSFLIDHIYLVEMDVQQDAPILDAAVPYPVLVFSHGLRGIRAQNTALVRELVSHGFVVATIDHTYGNVLTVFPDGRIALYSPDLFSGTGDPPRTSNTLVGVWAGDISTVLDQLAAWNSTEGSGFAGHLDLANVGVFGHSTGGGTAVEFCGRDQRCKAGVGLDAWLEPVSENIIDRGLTQPFLFLRADRWDFANSGENFEIADRLLSGLQDSGYLGTIAGAAHFDFSDVPLLSPLTAQLGLSSTIDSAYMVEMVNSMTSAFFRQELKGEGDDLSQQAMVYPELSLVGNGR